MLYDPLRTNVFTMNFENLDPISSYISQMDPMGLTDKLTKVKMKFTHRQFDTWMFEPLEGVILGMCGPERILETHEERFHCDAPMLIFILLLEGEYSVDFDGNSANAIELEKNMFSWGDWNNLSGVTTMPPQEKSCHLSFSIQREAFQKHFGMQTGVEILNQLQQSLNKAGVSTRHISGLANSELIAAGKRLLHIPHSSHLDVLELKAATIEFISKMIRNVLDCNTLSNSTFSQKDIEAIKQLKNTIENDIFRSGNIPELCASIGMSRSKASTIFKQQYNTTIGKYQHSCRMIYAHTMLLSRQRNVSECAYELGYTNIGHFITAFRKQYGMTPGETLCLGKITNATAT